MMVDSLEGDAREDGGGISGPKILKLRLTYSANAPPGLPSTMIFKWGSYANFTATSLPIRAYLWFNSQSMEGMLRCEAAVYKEVTPLLEAGIRVPKCFYVGEVFPKNRRGEPSDSNRCLFVCCGRRTAVRTVQLLEDASDEYEPGPIAHHTPDAEAVAIMNSLANLHAWGWGRDATTAIPGVWAISPHITAMIGRSARQLKPKAALSTGATLSKYIAMWKDYATMELDTTRVKTYEQHPEYLKVLQELVAGAAVWQPKAAAMFRSASPAGKGKPLGSTILHGDAHQWNHLFRKGADADKNDLVLIDWQWTGVRVARLLFLIAFRMWMDVQAVFHSIAPISQTTHTAMHCEYCRVATAAGRWCTSPCWAETLQPWRTTSCCSAHTTASSNSSWSRTRRSWRARQTTAGSDSTRSTAQRCSI